MRGMTSAGEPRDPSGADEPHDVLAAEEFALPARDPGRVPGDPAGIEQPHDVLAAEEFPLPAAAPGGGPPAPGAIEPRTYVPLALLALAALVLLLRRRRG
jgi:MYXO-CTERM domain-containing protein